MKCSLLLLVLVSLGCASYYKKSTLEENYATSYRFGCLDVMWEQKNFCKDEDAVKCMDAIQAKCDSYESRYRLFTHTNTCFYKDGTPCFRESK